MAGVAVGKSLGQLPFDLERGVYLQAEAARLTGLPRSTVRRWLEHERGDAGLSAVKDRPLVSFLELVSLHVLAAFRELGLTMGQVRKVSRYMRDVVYEPLSANRRVAASWEPPGVTIDPRVQRGAPCVAGSRVRIAQLARYVEAGDAPDRLAEVFELDCDDVRRALDWYGRLKRAA